jgi:hypothetical protein
MIATFFTKIRPKNDMIFPESSVHILKDIAVIDLLVYFPTRLSCRLFITNSSSHSLKRRCDYHR